MRIEIKKLEIKVDIEIKEKGKGNFEFGLEGYESELSEDEFKQYLDMIEEVIKSLQPPYIK